MFIETSFIWDDHWGKPAKNDISTTWIKLPMVKPRGRVRNVESPKNRSSIAAGVSHQLVFDLTPVYG